MILIRYHSFMKLLVTLLIFSTIILEAVNYDALLLNGNCTTCHFENKALSAPSLQEIRNTYLKKYPSKKDFVTAMSTWINSPTLKDALMHKAVEKYELMPELAFDMDTLRSITSYIYEHDFSSIKNNN